jgi:hypothetical protein
MAKAGLMAHTSHRSGWFAGPGLVLMSSLLMGMPLTSFHLGQIQALNRELGRLCTNPPREAITVCRIHATLVRSL